MEKSMASLVMQTMTQEFKGLEVIVYNRQTGNVTATNFFVNPMEKACRFYLLGELSEELGRKLLDTGARSLMISCGQQALWFQAITNEDCLGVLSRNPDDFQAVDTWLRDFFQKFALSNE